MKEFTYSFARSVYLRENAWKSPIFKAFLQPQSREKQEEVTPIGRIQHEKYLYLGPANHDLTKLSKAARVIDSAGVNYRILHAQKIYEGDKVFYLRAILEKEGV